MIRLRSVLSLMLVLAVFLSCHEQPSAVRPRIFFIVFDTTKSMPIADLEEGKMYVIWRIRPILRSGDWLVVGEVSGESFESRVRVFHLKDSPYYIPDKKIRAYNDSVLTEIKKVVESIQVQYLQSDILGILAKSSEIFQEHPEAEHILVIISDMEQNLDRNIKVNLNGARVYVLFASHKFQNQTDNVKAWQMKQEHWTNFFHEAGTDNTFIWDADQTKMRLDWLVSQFEEDT